jgi:hypothetical protein
VLLHETFEIMTGTIEAVAIAALPTVLLITQRHTPPWLRAAERGLGCIGRRHGLAVICMGLLALGGSATICGAPEGAKGELSEGEKAPDIYQGSYRAWLVLTVPLVLLPWVLRDRWARFALLTCGVLLAGLAVETWVMPHYAAPIAGLVCVLALQALRHLRVWRWYGRPTGRCAVWTIVVIAVASFIMAFAQQMQKKSSGWGSERARILAQLKEDGRRHLVIVRYGSLHSSLNEWVYNEANIDGAQVVWARDLGTIQNRKLLEWFKDRVVWLAEVGQDHSPLELVPYPIESHQ